jgi:hypothetical protein
MRLAGLAVRQFNRVSKLRGMDSSILEVGLRLLLLLQLKYARRLPLPMETFAATSWPQLVRQHSFASAWLQGPLLNTMHVPCVAAATAD